jgi:hypothetical protein
MAQQEKQTVLYTITLRSMIIFIIVTSALEALLNICYAGRNLGTAEQEVM